MLSQVTEFLSLLGLTNLPSRVHTFSLSSANKHLGCYQAWATGHKLQSTGVQASPQRFPVDTDPVVGLLRRLVALVLAP